MMVGWCGCYRDIAPTELAMMAEWFGCYKDIAPTELGGAWVLGHVAHAGDGPETE
jgi:hypothetical protein